MNWKKRIASLSFAVVILISLLSGCSLAKENAKEEAHKNKDRLIGVFVTTYYLDEIDKKMYGRIDKLGYTETKDCANWEIKFGDLEGIVFINYKFHEDEEAFSILMGDDDISNVTRKFDSNDDGKTEELTGDLYLFVSNDSPEIYLYVNPVYMTENGECYVIPAMGDYIASHFNTMPHAIVSNYKEETVNIEEGKKIKYSFEVELNVILLSSKPKQIRLNYMDENINKIKQETFEAGKLPERLNAVSGANCIVVETLWTDGRVTREFIEKEEITNLETFYEKSESIISKMNTEVKWK